MDDSWATREALFRYSVIGGIVSRPLVRGELARSLSELSGKNWTGPEYHRRGWRMSTRMLIVRWHPRQRYRRTRTMKSIATATWPSTCRR